MFLTPLIQAGMPPQFAAMVLLWTDQLKVAWMLVYLYRLQQIERQAHAELPPSEQYRQHIAAGGYRP